MGHCGMTRTNSGRYMFRTTFTTESHALNDIFIKFGLNVASINDSFSHNNRFNANSPKSRVINALKWFKANIEYFQNL